MAERELSQGSGSVVKSIVIIPDLQIPYHDMRALNAMWEFVEKFRPTTLACVGDEIDSPQVSRWTKALAGEYEPTLQKHLDITHGVMLNFRQAIGKGEFHVMRSNHGDRIENYVKRYAPGLSSLTALRIDALLRYEEIGVTYHRKPYELAPGWLLMHGDEGRLYATPGATALGLARKSGRSVVCGHTHRAGLIHWTEGTPGHTRTRWGLEVGHGMHTGKAGYLRLAGDWQQAMGVLTVDGGTVIPELVPVVNGRIYYGGRRYA